MNITKNDSDSNWTMPDEAESVPKSAPNPTPASEPTQPTSSQPEMSNSAGNPVTSFPSNLEVASSVEDNSDADSGLGILVASSTVSVRSSIFQYVEENGRTYHAYHEGKYMAPNDEEEQARLDLQHHLFRMTMDNKLCLAPLSNPQNVLDIATGTGIWAVEFAQEYPGSNVLGTDLSPIQPIFVPPNCRFEIDDAEDEWIFTQKFNFIHGRALLSCFKDNRFVVNSVFDALAPGGYFELQDPCMPMRSDDGTLNGTSLDKWQTHIISSLRTTGRNLSDSVNWGQYMKDAGFVDVVETRYYWGTNPWMRDEKKKLQAAWCQQNLLDGIQGMSMALFTRVLGWSTERIELLLANVRNDLKDRRIHAYAEVYVVYGRKPE